MLNNSAAEALCLSDGESSWSGSRGKRALDIAVSLSAFTVLLIPMLLIAACVRLSSPGPAIFFQERVGAKGKPFKILKFRTMTADRGQGGPGLTRTGDERITPFGRFLRRLKLDELPQLVNVLCGQMSLVGPRPKLPQYADEATLQSRPGITGAATLQFRGEEDLLRQFEDPRDMEDFYQQYVKPAKARLDCEYMRSCTLWSDVRLVIATAATCMGGKEASSVIRSLRRMHVNLLDSRVSSSVDQLPSSD